MNPSVSAKLRVPGTIHGPQSAAGLSGGRRIALRVGALGALFLLATACFSAEKQADWVLEKSEISYTVTHPLHEAHGKSSSAKGKGVCYSRHCEFLLAVPVKSFHSGDENRDLHMLEVTRAGLYPMVVVRAETDKIDLVRKPRIVKADVDVSFAGKKVEYPDIPLRVLDWRPEEAHITGMIPLSLKAFGIQAPSLLGMPIHDEVPVDLDMFWKYVGPKLSK